MNNFDHINGCKISLQLTVILYVFCISSSFSRSTSLQLEAPRYNQASTFEHKRATSSHPKLHSQKSRVIQLDSTSSSNNRSIREPNGTQQILRKYGFGQRIVALSNLSEQPIPCELYENGSWKLCVIVGLKSATDIKKVPLLVVQVLNDEWEEKVVDIGK